jgi:GcrA cell cycle regulator
MREVSTWTDETVKVLEKLWGDGLTSAAIGKVLGKTRNAVLGKVHRLALPQRFIASAKPRSCERVLETPPRMRPEKITRALHNKPAKPMAGDRNLRLHAVQRDEATVGEVDIMALREWHCRWPRSDASAPGGYMYCGGQRRDVGSYCAEHSAIAYQPPKPHPVGIKRTT